MCDGYTDVLSSRIVDLELDGVDTNSTMVGFNPVEIDP